MFILRDFGLRPGCCIVKLPFSDVENGCHVVDAGCRLVSKGSCTCYWVCLTGLSAGSM